MTRADYAISSFHKTTTRINQRNLIKVKLTTFNNYLEVLKSCEESSDLQLIDLEGRLSKF